jgi:hypothetical protein
VPTKMVWLTPKLWKLVHKQVERVHVFLEIKWFPHPFPHLFDLFSINAFITTLALEWNTYFTSINVMCQIILFSTLLPPFSSKIYLSSICCTQPFAAFNLILDIFSCPQEKWNWILFYTDIILCYQKQK